VNTVFHGWIGYNGWKLLATDDIIGHIISQLNTVGHVWMLLNTVNIGEHSFIWLDTVGCCWSRLIPLVTVFQGWIRLDKV